MSGRVAFLWGQGFDGAQLRIPRERLRGMGLELDVIEGAERVDALMPEDYDALLIPGGRGGADERLLEFVRRFDATGRPVGAVCRGPRLLGAAGLVRGRTLTASSAVQDELRALGAHVKDEPVVVDGNWITGRASSDLEAFSETLLRILGQSDRDEPEEPRARRGD
jgi:protease I